MNPYGLFSAPAEWTCSFASSHSRVSGSMYESTPPARANSAAPDRTASHAACTAIAPAACPVSIALDPPPAHRGGHRLLEPAMDQRRQRPSARPGRAGGRPTNTGTGGLPPGAAASGPIGLRRGRPGQLGEPVRPGQRLGPDTALSATIIRFPAVSTTNGCFSNPAIPARTAAAVAGAVIPTAVRAPTPTTTTVVPSGFTGGHSSSSGRRPDRPARSGRR